MPEEFRKTELLDSLEDMVETGMDVRPFSVEAARVYSEAGVSLG